MEAWIETKNKSIMEGKRLNSFIKHLNFKELMPFFTSYVSESNLLDGDNFSVYDLYNLQFLSKENLIKLSMTITQVILPEDQILQEGYLRMYLSIYALAMIEYDLDTCMEITNHLNIDTLINRFSNLIFRPQQVYVTSNKTHEDYLREYILEFVIEDLIYDNVFKVSSPIDSIEEYIEPINNHENIQPEVLNEFVDYIDQLAENLAESFYELYKFFLGKIDLKRDIIDDGLWKLGNIISEDLIHFNASGFSDYVMVERYIYAMYMMGTNNGKSYIIKDIYDIPEYSFTTLLERKISDILIGIYNIDRRILG